MKEIGGILKQARESKKLSIGAIHKSTKIKEAYITALENDDVKAFPAELYYKNFLKNYAKFLDLKAGELLEKYESAKKEEHKNEIKEQIKSTAINQKQQKKLIITLVLAAVMCAALIVFEFLLKQNNAPSVEYIEDVKISSAAAVAPKPEIPAEPQKQKLSVDASGSTWLSIETDNKKVFEGIVNKGENKTFSADNSFTVKIGNVLNAAVYFNDKKVDITSGASKNKVNSIILKKAEENAIEQP